MRRRTERIAFGFVVLVLGSSCSGARSYPQGVLVDTVHFTRTVLYQSTGMNLVSELRVGDFDHDGGNDILVLASDGIHLLDLDGKRKRFTRFQSTGTPSAVVSVADDTGVHGFVGNLPTKEQTVMFDESGREVWHVAGTRFDSPVVGAFDGGRAKVMARGSSGLQMFNLQGTLIRTWGPSIAPIFYSAADMDGDGKTDLVGKNAVQGKSEIFIASGDGTPVNRWTSPHRFYEFFLARLPGHVNPTVMFHSDDANELVFLDAAGAVVKTLPAPWGTTLAIPRGFAMTVAGKSGGFVCLASTTGSSHQHMVYVYASDDQLIYLDSVPDNALALLVVDRDTLGVPSPFFLVGGRNTIWKYAQ